jgi:hypothetical protein
MCVKLSTLCYHWISMNPKDAFLMLGWATGKLGLMRLIIARDLGKPPPSPLQYSLCLATGLAPKWDFVLGFPNESLKIPKVGILGTLGAHNFVWKPSTKMRFDAKLKPLLRSLQRYVARHLHARKPRWFPTFSGRESNCQLDSRPFFWP